MGADQEVMAAGWAWASARDEPDWEVQYVELLPRVHNFFRYRVGTGPEAEDLTATTFAKAWAARKRYRRDIAGFRTWIYAIARNVAIDHYRTRRVHVSIQHAAALPAAADAADDAERHSDAGRLHALLVRLPEREQELIALKFGAELSNREIARAVRLTESNVGTILHRSLAVLRAGWNEGERS